MKASVVCWVLGFLIVALFIKPVYSQNVLNSDKDYSVVIAVTINENEHIVGKLEYSNHDPQFPLQLVTFNSIGVVIHVEPYVFELLEKTIISKNVHRIRLRPVNDKYGDGSEIIGTIDFSNEIEPKIRLVNQNGFTYIRNISEKGKAMHMKYLPKVWLGQ